MARYRVLACEVLHREALHVAARAANQIDLSFITQGLHDLESSRMAGELQKELDATDAAKYQAVLLLFGLCNNGTVSLAARALSLVIPRAHDCITLFLGSRARYQELFSACPGTYYLTSGWLERDHTNLRQVSGTIQKKLGLDKSYQELVELYGEENAAYIHEQLHGLKNYRRYAYISQDFLEHLGHKELARRKAAEANLEFEVIPGDLSLLTRFFAGEWAEEDFLVLEPGEKLAASHDQRIIKAERAVDR